MKKIDKEHIEHPGKGVVGMTDFLLENNIKVGLRRVRRLMRLMGIQAVYRKRSLSTLGTAKYIKPYLLRGLKVDHGNQVWSIDITYIPMKKGFMYLTAIIDVYSRFIVGWSLHNSLDTSNCIEVLKRVLRQISCCQVKQVWKILIQRSRSEARPYILLLIYFILLFRPSISPLLIEYFMAFLMGEMSRWTLFTKLTTSP